VRALATNQDASRIALATDGGVKIRVLDWEEGWHRERRCRAESHILQRSEWTNVTRKKGNRDPKQGPVEADTAHVRTECGTTRRTKVLGPGYWIRCLALSGDGRPVVAGLADHTAQVWEADTLRPLLLLVEHDAPVVTVDIAADGRTAVTGSEDASAIVWDLITGEPTRKVTSQWGTVTVARFNAPGRGVVTGFEDGTLTLWEPESPAPPLVLEGHTDVITAVGLMPDHQRLASASCDGSVRVWDLTVGRCIAHFRGDAIPVACHVSEDGNVISGCDSTGALYELELVEGRATPSTAES